MATKALLQQPTIDTTIDKTNPTRVLHPIAREMQHNLHAKSGRVFYLCPVDAAEVEHDPHMLKGYKFVPAGPRCGRVREFKLEPKN